jgi:DNA repair protein RadC
MDASTDTFRRLRELGAEALTDKELLALLVRDAATGEHAEAIADRILAERSLAALGRQSTQALARQSGVSPMIAARIASAVELSRRVARELCTLPERVGDTEAVYRWAKPRIAHLPHEELWLLAIDGRNHVRASKRVCVGGGHGLAVTAKDVLRHALIEGAAAFVLVHNHPSGNPEPSELDARFTERVVAAAAGVEVPLLDHVVVAVSGYASVPLG